MANDFKTWCINNNRGFLLEEWDYERNTVSPSSISPKNPKKVWWKCTKGHSYLSSIGSRTGMNTGCPYCAGKKALFGFNDFASLYPELAKEWHPTKNGNMNPTAITPGSSKKVWWFGKCGHEWQACIRPRIKGVGCPYCANKKVLPGFNDLATLKPELINEWNYDKNTGLVDGNNVDISTPDKVTTVSGNKVWWKCSKGHEWQATIAHRTSRGDGCPYCYGRYVLPGINDLQTLFPEVAKEWNYEKNKSLTPSEVTARSEKKIWWKCPANHEWIATVAHRTNERNGCPYCSGRYAIKGVNDLATTNPELVNEWNYEKNGALKPEDVLPKSEKKVWWKCSKGHEWQTQISVRVLGSGCPRCSGVGTSLPEQGVAYYLETVCRVEQRVKAFGKEVDVYLPDYMIGIEYDGRFYHKTNNNQKEIEKDTRLHDNGIKPIRIKEADQNCLTNDNITDYIFYNADVMGNNYEWALKQLCHLLSKLTGNDTFDLIDINVKRDLLNIRERLRLYNKENSFVEKKPELIREWNYEKNGNLEPEMFSFGSGIKVWWKCAKGHEWQSSIVSRTKGYGGCPACNGHRLYKGVTDLLSVCPDLAKEWHPTRNGNLKPTDVTSGSMKKVWWLCPNGHSYLAGIYNRTRGKTKGCPYCLGKINTKEK